MKLEKSFYTRDTITVAKDLLGKNLCRKTPFGIIEAKIVETEAYLSENDPACHANRGMTPRNEPMFEEGGISYVYFIYGNYFCFNVVSDKKGFGTAVLIRAVEPLNHEIIKNYRNTKKIKDLTNGPSKLCMAMNITKEQNKLDLITSSEIFITDNESIKKNDIIETTRIGITQAQDLKLRFYIKDNIFVSKI
ncbi:MAG: DNA-3-methyladenine glycosylase [Candidatus Sericytochromatia bacterium]